MTTKAAWDLAISEAIRTANLGENDRLAVELLKLGPVPIECFSRWVPPETFLAALKEQDLPLRYQVQMLERLSGETQLEARLTVAESLATPLSLLEALAGDEEVSVRLSAQHNPNCPAAWVELVERQQVIAADPNTSAEQLTMLSESQWGWIRQTVAQNPAVPEAVLLKLAAEPVPLIREAIAHNPSVTAPVLTQLLAQPAEDTAVVTGIVVSHKNTPDALLKKIVRDDKRYIRHILYRDPLSESMFRFLAEQTQGESDTPLWRNCENTLIGNPSTPRWLLDQLADSAASDIRADVEQRRSDAEISLVERLVQEGVNARLAKLAKHPNASGSLSEEIAQTSDTDIQFSLAYNEQAPETVRLSTFDKLLENPDDRLLSKIARDPDTPVSVLERVAQQCTGSEPGLQTIQNMLRGQASQALLDAMRAFLSQHSDSATQVLFWLRQDLAFSKPIVQDWAEMRAALSETDRQVLNSLSQLSLPAAGLDGGIPSRDRWVIGSPDALNLYGFLTLFDASNRSGGLNRNWNVMIKLIGNPSTPAELRLSLTQQALNQVGADSSKAQRVYLALAFNTSVPDVERAKYFWPLLSDYDRNSRQALAEDSKTPLPVLLKLIEESQKKDGVWQSAAKNPNTPLEYLEELAQDKNSTTVGYVVANPGTPIELLRKISPDQCNYYSFTSGHPQADKIRAYLGDAEYYQRQLAIQAEQRLRAAEKVLLVRKNSAYAIAQVLKSNNPQAKILAARNPHTPPNIIEAIAQDKNPELRRAVVNHANLSETWLRELAQDEDSSVRFTLAQSGRSLSRTVIRHLMNSQNLQVLTTLASRITLPEDVLDGLASHPNKDVRISALVNPAVPTATLRRELPSVTDEKSLERILQGTNNKRSINLNMPPDLLERFSQHSNRTIRFLVARYPNANFITLERLAFDESDLVRQTVAENLSTPCDLLIRMAEREKLTTSVGCYHTVSSQICRRQDAPPEALGAIARQPIPSIRCMAVANANLASETLSWIAQNETDEAILKGVAILRM